MRAELRLKGSSYYFIQARSRPSNAILGLVTVKTNPVIFKNLNRVTPKLTTKPLSRGRNSLFLRGCLRQFIGLVRLSL